MAIVTLPLPIQLINGNVADGGQVMTDLNAIASNVNANAAKNGVNNDITSLTALISIVSGLTITGAFITGATINTSSFTSGTIVTSTIDAATTGVTQATGTNNTTLATTAFVIQTAFNSGLPAQSAGTVNMVPVSNGTNAVWQFLDLSVSVSGNLAVSRLNSGTNASVATYWRGDGSWSIPGIGAFTNVSSATTVTLTNASTGFQAVTMTALGQSVVLPDATTMVALAPRFVIRNAGSYTLGVRSNGGTLLTAITPGGIGYLMLESISSAAGVWSVEGNGLEPGLITVDSTFSSTYASTVYAQFVALDANTSIHFAALSSGFAAYVVDNTGKVVSTPVTVDATATAQPVQVFKVTATTAIVFYKTTGATASKAVILTLTGATPAFSLSVGAAISAADIHAWQNETYSGQPKIVQLSATLYLTSFSAGGAPVVNAVALSVAGAVITIGASVVVAATAVVESMTAYALTATTALVIYLVGAGPYNSVAVVLSVAGVTTTVGTPVTVTGVTQSSGVPITCLMSSTKAYLVMDNNSVSVAFTFITISGTTVTYLACVFVVEALARAQIYTTDSATRYTSHLFPIGASSALLWYFDINGVSRVVVVSENGATSTAGTKLYNSISGATTNVAMAGLIMPQSTTEFCAIRLQSGLATSAPLVAIIPHKISGTTLTFGAGKTARFISASNAPSMSTTRLSSGDYLVNGTIVNTATSVYRSNGDAMTYRGDITTPPLGYSPPIIQAGAVASNRVVLLSSTLSGGSTVSVTVDQLRLLNMEIAA